MIFTYEGMKCEGNKLWMNSTITVKEDILKEPKMSIKIERCENKENLDTCEHFYVYKTDKYCEVAEAKSAVWTPLYSSYVPEWKCPVKKGIYKATNAMIDVTAFLMVPFDSWFWRVNIKLNDKDTNRMITCVLVGAHITRQP
ncbi:hypothetical protein ILUMI_02659 [Ignelater luminosus]|uniref:Uncharacterized protein n=1 Tax=Ignelater luminosus TaxID=2038154 RepID=A0A8K0DG41_IGNLU|nr:hypothetical protein ILUMI_02659 [Ignelater luminosus]